MSDIFNWAMFVPGYLLNYHKRAVAYNAFSSVDRILVGVAGFIEEALVYDQDKFAFISVPDLCTRLEQYAESTGDSSVLFTRYNSKTYNLHAIKRNFIGSFTNDFGVSIKFDRYSRRDRKDRPWGFYNLAFRDPKIPMSKFQTSFTRVQSSTQDSIQIPSKFEAEEKISWLSVTTDEFLDGQRKILLHRQKQSLEKFLTSIQDVDTVFQESLAHTSNIDNDFENLYVNRSQNGPPPPPPPVGSDPLEDTHSPSEILAGQELASSFDD